MALRDKLAERASKFLEPGEQIQAVIYAQTGASPYWAILSQWIVLLTRGYYLIVVTDRSIVVLRSGFFRTTSPQNLTARLPRQPMDEPSGLWGQIHVGGTRYWVHRRFHKDVRAGNAAILGYQPQ
jgi:hypothetical protein